MNEYFEIPDKIFFVSCDIEKYKIVMILNKVWMISYQLMIQKYLE